MATQAANNVAITGGNIEVTTIKAETVQYNTLELLASAGNVTELSSALKANNPYAHYSRSGTYSTSHINIWKEIVWNETIVENQVVLADLDLSTDNDWDQVFMTPSIPGVYMFHLSARTVTGTYYSSGKYIAPNIRWEIKIINNEGVQTDYISLHESQGTGDRFSSSGMVELEDGDSVSVYLYLYGGSGAVNVYDDISFKLRLMP